MKYLLYYNLDSKFASDQTSAGGDGTNVVSVVDGVAWTKDQEKTYYRLSGKNEDIVTCTITVNYVTYDPIMDKTFTVASSTKIPVNVYKNKKTKVKVLPKEIENYTCQESYRMVDVANNVTITFTYTEKSIPDGILRAYYVKSSSSTKLFWLDSSTITTYNESLYNYINGIVVDGIYNTYVTGNTFQFDGLQMDTSIGSIHRVDFKLKTKDTASGAKDNYILRGYAFSGCNDLVSCVVPKNITYCYIDSNTGVTYVPYKVPNGMFYACKGLTSLTIENGIKSLGSSMCSSCSSLNTLILPNTLREGGFYAFNSCVSLREITFPESYVSGGEAMFYGCTGLTSVTFPNTIKKIAGNIFQNCSSLKNINIPDSVEEVGVLSFDRCYSLESVTIGNGTKKIGWGAFLRCSSLTSITLGSSLELIDSRRDASAFSGCTSLRLIKISAPYEPDVNYYNVTTAFSGIASNGILIYPAESSYSTWLSTQDGYLGYYGWSGIPAYAIATYETTQENESIRILSENQISAQTEIYVDGELISQEDIQGTSAYTFQNKGAHEIIISGSYDKVSFDSKERFAKSAICFVNCDKLIHAELLSVPNAIKAELPESMFSGCISLTAATFCDLPTKGNYTIPENCFAHTKVKQFKFPKLNNQNYPIVFGCGAFFMCDDLEHIDFNENNNTVCKLGSKSFAGCSELDFDNFDFSQVIGNNKDGTYGDTYGYRGFDEYCLCGCTKLKHVEISSAVTFIGAGAFKMTSISSLTVPDTVIEIGAGAFDKTPWLESGGCPVYDDVYYPNNIIAYRYAKGKETYTIRPGTKYIGQHCFDNNSKLTGITIPEGVIQIYSYAFNVCRKLNSITLPSTLVKMCSTYRDGSTTWYEDDVFANTKLNSITSYAEVAPFANANSFKNIPENGVIKVPSAYLNSYDTRWYTGTCDVFHDSMPFKGKNWTLEALTE